MMVRMTDYLSSRMTPFRSAVIKLTLFAIPAFLIVGLLILKLGHRRVYWNLVIEDGPIEWLTSLVYFLSFLIASSIAVQFYRQKQQLHSILYTILAIGFLFICLEEISWGQRIFDIEAREFSKAGNRQREINLHNFASRRLLHGSYIVVGAYGAFAFLLIPRATRERVDSSIDLFVPTWYMSLYFVPILVLYLYYDYLSSVLISLFGEQFRWGRGKGFHRFIISKDQEPVELILALGFLLFVIVNKYKQTLGKFQSRR